jgi:hypothetical protein
MSGLDIIRDSIFWDDHTNAILRDKNKKWWNVSKYDDAVFNKMLVRDIWMLLQDSWSTLYDNRHIATDLKNLDINGNISLQALPEKIASQLMHLINKPDPNSHFAVAMQAIIWKDNGLKDQAELLKNMLQQWYGLKGKLTPDGDLVSFVAYIQDPQQQIIKVFSLQNHPLYQKQWLVMELLQSLKDQNPTWILQIGEWPAEKKEWDPVNPAAEKKIIAFEKLWYSVNKNTFQVLINPKD